MNIKLPSEQKKMIVDAIKQYFATERGEEIGDLAAGLLIDFMIKHLGPILYNQAIEDVRHMLNEKLAQVEDELYALEKPVRFDRD